LRSLIHFMKTWHEYCPVKPINKKMRNFTSREHHDGR